MNWYKKITKKAAEVKSEASDLWGGLTDATGDIVESTDNADTWSVRASDVGSKDAEHITSNIPKPL